MSNLCFPIVSEITGPCSEFYTGNFRSPIVRDSLMRVIHVYPIDHFVLFSRAQHRLLGSKIADNADVRDFFGPEQNRALPANVNRTCGTFLLNKTVDRIAIIQ